MNKTLKLAVAGAVLAMSSAANAGIIIPAGDWTVDINGNVNAFYIHENGSDTNTVAGGLARKRTAANTNGANTSNINTGLLPSWFGVTGKKRENDLDISWTISYQPGASTKNGLANNPAVGGGAGAEFRQANMTIGDKSWGTIKLGKDLGLFGADAILNDQTLLGVGATGGGASGTTTYGRIGTGFLYADFTGQIAYTSPNWNGFQFTAEIAQPWINANTMGYANTTASLVGNREPAFEGNVNYSWAGDVSGKIWLEGFTQKVDNIATGGALKRDRGNVYGIGGKVGFAGAELVGYYYNGEGVGSTLLLDGGWDSQGNRRDSDGGYVQASYKIPNVGTKLAVSWGESNLDRSGSAGDLAATTLLKSNQMWTAGVYHPLTSNVNLVAEYSRVESENQAGATNKSDIFDLGAILFF
ncbi:MAG: porin [Nitrosomonadales bacterium]|nr:MAG: porin [Nitrosomonadales bacterium]